MQVYYVETICRQCDTKFSLYMPLGEMPGLENPDNHGCPQSWCDKGNLMITSKKLVDIEIKETKTTRTS